jgi:hypothetical protein
VEFVIVASNKRKRRRKVRERRKREVRRSFLSDNSDS